MTFDPPRIPFSCALRHLLSHLLAAQDKIGWRSALSLRHRCATRWRSADPLVAQVAQRWRTALALRHPLRLCAP